LRPDWGRDELLGICTLPQFKLPVGAVPKKIQNTKKKKYDENIPF